MEAVPRCLSDKFGGTLTTTAGSGGAERPVSTTYRVSVPLVDRERTIVAGSSGWARIRVGSRPLSAWLWRWICQTIRFEL
jgi:hypothetical protein